MEMYRENNPNQYSKGGWRKALFKTFYNIENSIPEINCVNFFIAIIEMIQLIVFPFMKTLQRFWKPHKIYETILSITYLIDPTMLADEGYTSYSIELPCFCGLIVFTYILFFFTLLFPLLRRRVHFVLILQKILIKSFGTFLYVPSLILFFNVFRCQMVNGMRMLGVEEELECWTGLHLTFSLFSILCIVLLILLGIFYIPFSNEINWKSGNIFAKYSNKVEFVNLVSRTCIGAAFLINDTQLHILFSLIFIFFGILQFSCLNKENPYYCLMISRFMESCLMLQIWSGICLFMGMSLSDISTSSIFIIGIPFIIFTSVFLMKNSHTRLLENEDFLNKKNLDEREALKQISIFQTGISKGKIDRALFFLFAGYIVKHMKFCKNRECSICKEDHLRWFATSLRKNTEYGKANNILKCLSEIFQQTMESYPHFRILKLSYLIFLIENMQNLNMAFSFTQKMYLDSELNIWDKFELYKIIKKISDTARDKALKMKDTVNICKQIEFSKFQHRILEAIGAYSKLWHSLNCQEPIASELETTVVKIIQIKGKIKKQFRNFEVNEYQNVELKFRKRCCIYF